MADELQQREPKEPSQEVSAWLALALTPGVGADLRQRLLEHFSSVSAILDSSVAELREVPGVGRQIADALHTARTNPLVAATEKTCAEHGIRIWPAPDFPPQLAAIPDPPALLFTRGTVQDCDQLAVAVVGARHASSYGRRQAQRLAASLVQVGMTVVSGWARGIDMEAHRAAWEHGGRTLAVLASGVLNVYPPEHERWVDRLLEQGALLSENLPYARPLRGSFPRRNRLITGLSLATIVVEAARRSGALISARLAGEQGREVFAVPGSVESRMSRGCHQLIRDGAKLVETVDDVLEELGPLVQSTLDRQGHRVSVPAELCLTDQERAVLDTIEYEPTAIDCVVQKTQLPTSRVLATLSVLESRALVRRLTGQFVVRRYGGTR